jgi:hypothetical protein
MKLNKKILSAAILFGLFSLITTIAIIARPKSFDSWFMFGGSIILFSATLIKLWRYRQLDPQISPDKHTLITTEFKNSTIVFPNGYYFRWSNVKAGSNIDAQRITEVNLNTAPPSFVLDNKEVVFVKYEYKSELENFANKNNIPIVQRPEIWEMLCEPFLDTTFDENHQKETIKSLITNGLTEEEVIAIRKKIENRMLLVNSIVWEWVHLGQFDYLNWTTFLFKSKYWWTMEIALRNLNVTKKVSH